MILRDVYLKGHFLVLRDRDGSTVELTLEDTSDLTVSRLYVHTNSGR
jgi:hypothetical protein